MMDNNSVKLKVNDYVLITDPKSRFYLDIAKIVEIQKDGDIIIGYKSEINYYKTCRTELISLSVSSAEKCKVLMFENR